MDAVKMIMERRSVRKFKPNAVDRDTMREIVDVARWAPSWANYQVARYTLIDDQETISRLSTEGVKGFVYNAKTLERATGVAVLSFVKGKSGTLDLDDYDHDASKANAWEAFDAGIACQTFCLAAHANGIGTCIFGVIDEDSVAAIINLPKEETVAALIVYGKPDETPPPTKRKEVNEILRFV